MATNKLPAMNMQGNLSKNWKQWRKLFEAHMEATNMKIQPDEIICAQVLIALGEEAIKIYNTFDFKGSEKKNVNALLNKFEEHFNGSKNLTLQRHKFINFKQLPGDNFETFANRLKKEAKLCEWGELNESMIKIIIINGINDDLLKKHLLEHDEMTLQQTIEYCKVAENIKKVCNMSSLKIQDEATGSEDGPPAKRFCKCCGTKHEKAKCPAFRKVCPVCKKPNHFAKMCRNKNDGSMA